MTATQLSLFSNPEDNNLSRRQKKAKLGRYERLQRELELKNQDSYKMLVDVESPATPASSYTFVDLFCGAGGNTVRIRSAPYVEWTGGLGERTKFISDLLFPKSPASPCPQVQTDARELQNLPVLGQEG